MNDRNHMLIFLIICFCILSSLVTAVLTAGYCYSETLTVLQTCAVTQDEN